MKLQKISKYISKPFTNNSRRWCLSQCLEGLGWGHRHVNNFSFFISTKRGEHVFSIGVPCTGDGGWRGTSSENRGVYGVNTKPGLTSGDTQKRCFMNTETVPPKYYNYYEGNRPRRGTGKGKVRYIKPRNRPETS